MGTFNLPPPVSHINVISSSMMVPRQCSLRNNYFSNTWPLTPSIATLEEGKVGGMYYPICVIEISYQSIINSTYYDSILLSTEDVDDDVELVSTIYSTLDMDYLDIVLPYDEEILEEMTVVER